MKKACKILALVLIFGTLVCMLASCSRTLNGTYKSTDVDSSLLTGTLTFDKDNKVTGSLNTPLGSISIDGDYVIEDGNITFTYSAFGFSKDTTYSFEKDGDSIFIDSSEFVKQK